MMPLNAEEGGDALAYRWWGVSRGGELTHCWLSV